jgi:hypothetical protein
MLEVFQHFGQALWLQNFFFLRNLPLSFLHAITYPQLLLHLFSIPFSHNSFSVTSFPNLVTGLYHISHG